MQSERLGKRFSKRLQRLVCSGLVPPKDLEEYSAELRNLVANLADHDLLESRIRVLKALADEMRLKILWLLSQREMCVCELTVALDLTQPTASHHLNVLRNAGLIRDRREGRWAFYSLAKPEVVQSLFALLGFRS